MLLVGFLWVVEWDNFIFLLYANLCFLNIKTMYYPDEFSITKNLPFL